MKRKVMENLNNQKTKRVISISFKIVGLIVCLLLSLLILANLTLVIKGIVNPKVPPSVLGIIPLSVMSDSMDNGETGAIKTGDLVLIKVRKSGQTIDPQDIISFLTEKDEVITHRVSESGEDIQGKYYVTKGDANNNFDMEINGEPAKVRDDSVLGIYYMRIASLGFVSLALQTPIGLILFLGVPVLLITIYDVLRRRSVKNKVQCDCVEKVASNINEEDSKEDEGNVALEMVLDKEIEKPKINNMEE